MSRSDYKSLSKGYLDNTRSYGGHQIYPNNAVQNKSVENFNFDNAFISKLYKGGTRLRALVHRKALGSSTITYTIMNIIIVKYDSGDKYKVKLDTGNGNSYQSGADQTFVGISLSGSNYLNFIIDINDTSKEYSIPYHSIIAKNPYTLYTNSPQMYGSLLTNFSSTGQTFSNVPLDDNLFLQLKNGMTDDCSVNVYISNPYIPENRLYMNTATYDLTKSINIGGETYQIKKDNNNRYYVEIINPNKPKQDCVGTYSAESLVIDPISKTGFYQKTYSVSTNPQCGGNPCPITLAKRNATDAEVNSECCILETKYNPNNHKIETKNVLNSSKTNCSGYICKSTSNVTRDPTTKDCNLIVKKQYDSPCLLGKGGDKTTKYIHNRTTSTTESTLGFNLCKPNPEVLKQTNKIC